MREFRFTCKGKPSGLWRKSWYDAARDAVLAHQAIWTSPHAVAFLDDGAEIERHEIDEMVDGVEISASRH
jgi:hypothetical protein